MSRALHGILNLGKPSGRTSRDVVDQVLRAIPGRPKEKPKVGHAGTLDPLATGVLVVCVGAATRLIERIQEMPKTYEAAIRLGATSSTLDADGPIVETAGPIAIPSIAEVEQALRTQVGEIQQVPPQFSALRVGGRRAYESARAGVEVELSARTVRVDAVRLIRFQWPRLDIEVDCGGGTYIRSIARDVGDALGSGGLIEVLTRTRIGRFRIEDALDPDALTLDVLERHLQPMLDAVPNLPRLHVNDDQAVRIRRGGAPTIPIPIPPQPDEATTPREWALIGPVGDLVAIAEFDHRRKGLAPRRVFGETSSGSPPTRL